MVKLAGSSHETPRHSMKGFSTMRKALFSSVLAATALLAVSGPAHADEEFDVTVNGNTVTVTTKGSWHVNKEYPWKLTVGETKLDKSKFTLEENKAAVSGAPKGAGVLKVGVCSGSQCKNVEKTITIN
jgi:hypothetical protein